ncbi:MAG: ComEA family DNA-binding protein [Desulfonatronovibrionaceae bacterium]
MLIPGVVYRAWAACPYAAKGLMRRRDNWRLSREAARLECLMGSEIKSWQEEELAAGIFLIIAAWGRGMKSTEMLSILDQDTARLEGHLQRVRPSLPRTAPVLEQCRAYAAFGPRKELAVLSILAARLAGSMQDEQLPEFLLQTDEAILRQGPRTVLQDRMLEVFGDFAGLHMLEHHEDTSLPDKMIPEDPVGSDNGKLDLNTATLEELQTLPHIGQERAREIIAMRPLDDIEKLQEINGIGPKRLKSIRKYAEAK